MYIAIDMIMTVGVLIDPDNQMSYCASSPEGILWYFCFFVVELDPKLENVDKENVLHIAVQSGYEDKEISEVAEKLLSFRYK